MLAAAMAENSQPALRHPCTRCGALILPITSEFNNGLCTPCFNQLKAVQNLRQGHASAIKEYYVRKQGRRRSIIELIACPEKAEGQIVRVHGFVVVRIEASAVYLSEADALNRIYENGIGLELPDEAWKDRSKYHRKYSIVEGTFVSLLEFGDSRPFSGHITNLIRLDPIDQHPEIEQSNY